ncbi:hypothetical protein LAZ67_6003921 [Cordylochernes scorpioides]|uniref:Helix-turn-helix domain-containing protein n=1 Tax=Cordylochernes scorpioides TaxID=51811 RepID=A0ABY6KL01_9ARAC|nr:hypothetical protein LAZ67_6003921 [Cordylochernes scorpioides]
MTMFESENYARVSMPSIDLSEIGDTNDRRLLSPMLRDGGATASISSTPDFLSHVQQSPVLPNSIMVSFDVAFITNRHFFHHTYIFLRTAHLAIKLIVKTLTKRIFTHCTTEISKQQETNTILSHLLSLGYPKIFILRHFHNPLQTAVNHSYKSICTIPFSPQSLNISNYLKSFGIRTFYSNTPNLGTLLRNPITKNSFPPQPIHFNNAVYSLKCNNCSSLYIGETGRHIKDRIDEHIRNIRNNDPRSLIAQHISNTGHTFNTIEPQVFGRTFMGNVNSENFSDLVNKLECITSLKIFFHHSHLDCFSGNLDAVSDEHGERCPQNISSMEKRYQDPRLTNVVCHLMCRVLCELELCLKGILYLHSQNASADLFSGKSLSETFKSKISKNHCNSQSRKQSFTTVNALPRQALTPEQKSSLRDGQIRLMEKATNINAPNFSRRPTQVPIAQTSQDLTTPDPHELTVEDEMFKNPQHD